jgi:hypothetical protein
VSLVAEFFGFCLSWLVIAGQSQWLACASHQTSLARCFWSFKFLAKFNLIEMLVAATE